MLITSESSLFSQQLPIPLLSYCCFFAVRGACAELLFSGAPPAAVGSLLVVMAALRSRYCCESRFVVDVLLSGLCDLSWSVSVISISAPPAGIGFLMALL